MIKISIIGQSAFGESVAKEILKMNGTIISSIFSSSNPKDPLYQFGLENDLPVKNFKRLRDNEAIESFKSFDVDLLVMAYVTDIVPMEIIKSPRLGTIQYHPSLLPLYRGPSPVASAILDGAKETGVSIMLLDKGMDSGPILLQSQSVQLNGEEKNSELSSRLFDIGSNLLTESLKSFFNAKIIPKEQHHEGATYTSIIRSSDGEINWNDKAQKIFNLYRAYDDWPGIYTFWNGKRIKLIQVQISNIQFPGILPGEVKYLDNKFFIGTSTVPIKIDYLQIEGKKIMKSEEFFRGYSSIVDTNLSI